MELNKHSEVQKAVAVDKMNIGSCSLGHLRAGMQARHSQCSEAAWAREHTEKRHREMAVMLVAEPSEEEHRGGS